MWWTTGSTCTWFAALQLNWWFATTFISYFGETTSLSSSAFCLLEVTASISVSGLNLCYLTSDLLLESGFCSDCRRLSEILKWEFSFFVTRESTLHGENMHALEKVWLSLGHVQGCSDFSQNLTVVLALPNRNQLCCVPFVSISLTAMFLRIKFKYNHSFLVSKEESNVAGHKAWCVSESSFWYCVLENGLQISV